jgi:hypothetical protein
MFIYVIHNYVVDWGVYVDMFMLISKIIIIGQFVGICFNVVLKIEMK